MTHLPAVRHAALEHRGTDRRALHLHFARPLNARDQMMVIGEIGMFHALHGGSGLVLLPEFPEDHEEIVLLNPAVGQDPARDEDFKAAARHFGFTAPDGILPFVGRGQCLVRLDDTEPNEPLFIAELPLMRQ